MITNEDIDMWNNDIVEADVADNDHNNDTSGSSDKNIINPTRITHASALEHVNDLLLWCNQNNNAGQHIPILQDLRNFKIKATKKSNTKPVC